MAHQIAGWFTFYCLVWLCWALAAPIVTEAAREPVRMQVVCQYPVVSHGVGGDLRTWTRVYDLCAN